MILPSWLLHEPALPLKSLPSRLLATKQNGIRRGHSSSGRASGLHPEGEGFDSPWLHHFLTELATPTMPELLPTIESPADLKGLTLPQLRQLAQELREYILTTVSQVGGHLSSNLGTIELTVALHHVFDAPTDRIIWDVGHQTYAHKVLTGRRDQLNTIRQYGGLSGFPKRSESDYDSFGTAHASTSISAALGMAAGGAPGRIVAVIGDGALSGGMAFEALNNAGARKDLDVLVILNDNDMSISPAVGALRQNLARILSSTLYAKVRRGSGQVMPPTLRDFAAKAEEHLKGMVLPGTLFEEFGFDYYGPLSGHDMEALVATLGELRDRPGPRLLHVATVKGKGLAAAEEDPVKHHGVSPPAARHGANKTPAAPAATTYSQVFGKWACAAAARDAKVCCITPAMREGSGLVEYAQRFPQRYYDTGIAEQHAVTFCAGLACAGMKPVLAIYSTFLQRGYDQLIHDVCLQNLPVVFAIDRAGFVGADGATHHGAFDLTFMRCIPNLQILVPADEEQCWRMLNAALAAPGPVAVRYPRGSGPGVTPPQDPTATLAIGCAASVRQGKKLALLACGPLVGMAAPVADELDATLVDLRSIKPLDEQLLLEVAAAHSCLLTLEENVVAGGAGSAIAELLTAHGQQSKIRHLGMPDDFIDHGSVAQLREAAGLTTSNIRILAKEMLNS